VANPPDFSSLKRAQRIASNKRLSFNYVIQSGSPTAQSIAEPIPTATPTPTPTITPTPANFLTSEDSNPLLTQDSINIIV